MSYCPFRPYMLCPLYEKYANFDEADAKEEAQAGFSFIRFLHASPNTPSLDVYIGDRKAVSNLPYASMAGYAALPSAEHDIDIYPMGQKGKALLHFTINPAAESYHTFVIAGLLPNLQYRVYKDSSEVIPGTRSRLRFIHMSPSAPSMDVAEEGGDMIFSGITFGRSEDYIALDPKIYILRVRAAGTPNAILDLPDITLGGSRAYTIYAIGVLGGSPPLMAVILSDGRR